MHCCAARQCMWPGTGVQRLCGSMRRASSSFCLRRLCSGSPGGPAALGCQLPKGPPAGGGEPAVSGLTAPCPGVVQEEGRLYAGPAMQQGAAACSLLGRVQQRVRQRRLCRLGVRLRAGRGG